MELRRSQLPHSSPFLFLFAFLYHPSFSITSPIRKQLPFPTIYNLLGPLINPAKPNVMVLGVYKRELGPVFANALQKNGIRRAWVVCGDEGLDEISPEGPTHVRSKLLVVCLADRRTGLGYNADQYHRANSHSS